MARIKKIKKMRQYCAGENPFPITTTTKMLICRYTYEGLSKSRITRLLGRSEAVIDEILNECHKNGDYKRFNYFGRLI